MHGSICTIQEIVKLESSPSRIAKKEARGQPHGSTLAIEHAITRIKGYTGVGIYRYGLYAYGPCSYDPIWLWPTADPRIYPPLAYTVTAYIVMAFMVMAYVVMAFGGSKDIPAIADGACIALPE